MCLSIPSLKQNLVNVLKIVVTVALFAFLLTRIDLKLVWNIILEANVPLLLLAIVLYCGAILLGAVKWQILVKAQEIEVSLGALLSYSLMGLFFGNILPSNIGGDVMASDLARVTRGRRRSGSDFCAGGPPHGVIAFSPRLSYRGAGDVDAGASAAIGAD